MCRFKFIYKYVSIHFIIWTILTHYRKIKECLHTKLFAIWTENASALNSKVLSSISGRHTQKLNNLSEGKSRSVFSNCLRLHGLFSSWNSLDQNTEVDSLSLLQGIFPTQASNPGLSHCRQIIYQLSHKGSPRILEWVA